jgi:hypothetical protein
VNEIAGWWGRVGPVKRVVFVLVALVVGANAGLAALDSVVGSDPGGPAGSSYATAEDGLAAWSDLLRARGTAVEALREPLGEADLPGGGTVVIAEPEDAPTADALRALGRHLQDGGRVVTVGEGGAAYAGALLGADLRWSRDGTAEPEPVGPTLAGLTALVGEGIGAFTEPGPTTVEAGPLDRPVIVSATGPDGGSLVAVADAGLLANAHLAEADDAALAVLLAGDGPVAFAEAEHGYGRARGLDAVPGRWKATVLGLVLATLLGFWSVGQRLGPAEVADRPLPPARLAYVDAVAAALPHTTPTSPPGGDP